jgi:hypothetical protein
MIVLVALPRCCHWFSLCTYSKTFNKYFLKIFDKNIWLVDLYIKIRWPRFWQSDLLFIRVMYSYEIWTIFTVADVKLNLDSSWPRFWLYDLLSCLLIYYYWILTMCTVLDVNLNIYISLSRWPSNFLWLF